MCFNYYLFKMSEAKIMDDYERRIATAKSLVDYEERMAMQGPNLALPICWFSIGFFAALLIIAVVLKNG